MKNLLMVLALALGTTVMVSAQTKPAQATTPAKEVKGTKKEAKKAHKVEAAKTATTAESAAAKK